MGRATCKVVESPSWDGWPGANHTSVPSGVFVLVKIDPVASVAILEDEETTRAAAALATHEWVLAVVTGTTVGMILHAGGRENMSIMMQTFGQGLPSAKPIASIPVAPSPQVYDDRPPLQFNTPLPWPNIYLHTYYSSCLFVSRILHSATGFETQLTEEQVYSVIEFTVLDKFYYDELPPVSEGPREPSEPPIPNNSFDDSGESDSSSGSDEPLHARELNEVAMKVDQLRLYGEICLDPSLCSGPLGAPADMEEPIRRIRELWVAWEERRTTEILARRAETDAWARGVATALAGRDEFDTEFEVDHPHASLDEDDILPEDAVDARLEKARAARRARRLDAVLQVNEPVADGHCANILPPPALNSRQPEAQPLATTSPSTVSQVNLPDLQAEDASGDALVLSPRESRGHEESPGSDSAAADVRSVDIPAESSIALPRMGRRFQGVAKSPGAASAIANAIARIKCMFTRRWQGRPA